MRKSTDIRTSAVTAIAAALALSSTAAFGQEAPVTPTPTPPSTSAPAPSTTPDTASDVPLQTDVAPVQSTDSTPVAATAVPAARATPRKSTRAEISRRLSAQAARPAQRVRSTASHPAHVAVTRDKITTSSPDMRTEAQTVPTPPIAAVPEPTGAKLQSNAPIPHSRAPKNNEAPIAAGGVLALLALGGAAFALRRRRSIERDAFEEDTGQMNDYSDMPEEQVPAMQADEERETIVAPPNSAFRWPTDNQAGSHAMNDEKVERDDREPGETWIERAYRGPSPLNPSLSLKTRLKRAAFFDKRERAAAAGLAAPIDPGAGLPDRVVQDRTSAFETV